MPNRSVRSIFTRVLTPFANGVRPVASGPITWRTVVGLVAVPVIIVSLLGWAFWAPTSDHGTAKAAVVNKDKMVTVAGKKVPLGRELAGKLTHNDKSAYDWTLTDAEDASSGLADGEYSAVVTIPPNFSAKAISASQATGGKDVQPLDASKARIQVQTSDRGGVVDPIASNEVAKATLDTFNQQVVQTYLDNIYVGFNSIHDQLAKAAGGAGKLASGAGQLSGGAGKLAGGTKQLDAAVGQLDNGASQLASGTGRLADGSGQLAGGMTKLEQQTASLPALTKKLADGARQVANGNKKLAATVVPIADKIIKIIDESPSAQKSADDFSAMAKKCEPSGGDPQFCGNLTKLAQQFSAQSGALESGRNSLRASAVQAKNGMNALAYGADKVADGNEALAANSGKLAGGISTAAGGARKLDDGVRKLHNGTEKLASGTGKLAENTPQLAAGAGKLASGSEQLAGGTKKFADGLEKGGKQAPTYNPAERDHLKQVAASPASAATSGANEFSAGVIALLVVIALWAGALMTYVLTRALPPGVRTSRQPTWQIVIRAALPGAGIATVTAATISLALAPFLDLGVGAWFGLLGVAVLTANTFAAVNHAVVSIFGRPGRLASIAVLVLTLAMGVVATIPAFFSSVGGVLPTAGAVEALRAITTGSGDVTSGIVELCAWLVVGTIATIAVTDRRRSVPAKQLRLAAGRS